MNKIELKQRSLNQIRHCLTEYYSNLTSFVYTKIFCDNISMIIFNNNYSKIFQWLLKSKFLNFMTNVNHETKSWNKMKQNETFFHGTYSNLTSFFIGGKILFQYCNDFYNWHLSISLQKWAQTSKVK